MIIGSRQRMAEIDTDMELKVNDKYLRRVEHTQCLGLQIDEHLTWEKHIEYIIQKVVCNISILRKCSSILTLNHDILLKKLEYFGFDHSSISFFRSYLSNRQQQCNVNGFSSDYLDITCGVPQGTILGPLLFLIYVNDLPKCLEHCTARLYADDTSMSTSSFHATVIEQEMNKDLMNVSSWLMANKLTLSVF